MLCGRLTIAIALLLLLSQLQCLAVCVAEGCPSFGTSQTQNVPPCHRHQSGSGTHQSAPCERQVVASAAVLPAAPLTGGSSSLSVLIPLEAGPQDSLSAPDVRTIAPSGDNIRLSAVLRI